MDKRVARSKHNIKQTFLRLLHAKPFAQITISELIKEANYNRGTFYSHFETKEKLLDEVIKDVIEQLIVQIRQPYKHSEVVNMRELNTDSITLFSYLKENADLYRLMLSDHIQVDFRHKIAKAIEELFIREYDYQFTDETHVHLKWLYIYRAHGVAGLIIRWIEENFPTTPQFMAEQVVELMVISTETFYVKQH